MARELPIHNGRLTTDLDADGHRIVNLPGDGTDTISWENVTDKPTFSTVATSGSYNDLSNKPTIPAPVDVSGKADKSEMLVTPGTGADADKTTIQLKSGTSATVLTAHQDVSGKANASEVNAALALKANSDAIPYALVVPGEWTYSGDIDGFTNLEVTYSDSSGNWYLSYEYNGYPGQSDGVAGDGTELTLEFTHLGEPWRITATRTLPDHLADRAVNAVDVSTDKPLTLPQANPGHSRDLYVRLTVSATSSVTWVVAQGESWDAMGAPPSSFTAGTHLYRFTEVAAGVWHCEDMLALVGLEAALAGKIPQYSMVGVTPTSGTLTVAPYTVATYTAGSSAESFKVAVGAGTTGKARDCILVIDGTATGAVAPTVTWPSNFHPRTDAGTDFACEAGVRNVYYISEYAVGAFAVGGWQETAGGNGT